jgi:hypothetical protein
MSALLDVLGASAGAAAGRAGDDGSGCASTGSPMKTSGLSAWLRSCCASLSLSCMMVHSCSGHIIVVIVIVVLQLARAIYAPTIGLRVVRATIVAVAAVLVSAAAVVVVSLF